MSAAILRHLSSSLHLAVVIQVESINVVAREDKDGEVVEVVEDATNKTDIFFLNPSS